MRTATNHSWSPWDLVTRLHPRRSCASSSWIGHKACAPEDDSLLTHLFFHFAAFISADCAAFCSLFSPSEWSASSSAWYSATTFQPSSDRSAIRIYELLPFGNQLPASIESLQADAVECWRRTRSRHAGRPAPLQLSFSSREGWTHGNERTYKWATNWLTDGFWGITRNTRGGR